MIHIYGTSHVSEDSMELINEKIEQHDPDIVALELDMTRLDALLNGYDSTEGSPVFLKLVKKFQDFIGEKTGVMPGEEMLYAYRKSIAEGREVALIDQDIRFTVDRLKEVSRKEKVRAVMESGLGFLVPGDSFDVSEIPDEQLIQELLDELEDRYPGLYRVLVVERNQVMAEYLRSLEEQEPDAEIVAFVGAAHRKDLVEMMEVEGGR
ncbi:MAG: TraB domain-containing protein [Candidatus Nanohaloarchaea archaeon]